MGLWRVVAAALEEMGRLRQDLKDVDTRVTLGERERDQSSVTRNTPVSRLVETLPPLTPSHLGREDSEAGVRVVEGDEGGGRHVGGGAGDGPGGQGVGGEQVEQPLAATAGRRDTRTTHAHV